MEGVQYTLHPDTDLYSDDEEGDLDYEASSAATSSLISPDQSDCSMRAGSDGGRFSSLVSEGGKGSIVSTIYPEDSVSQRPPPSETSEANSVKALQDGDNLFRTVYGRTYSTQSDFYMLPSDEPEHNRLDIQHRLLQYAINSLYYPVETVRRALTPSDHYPTPGVLDIGTGSGRWALDMAHEFPHAECVGLDLVPPILMGIDNVPPNCRFEIDDANLSLSHYANTFNVIHMRAANAGINDFESFLYNAAQALRPHGVILLCAGSPQFCDENFNPLPLKEEGQPGFTWLQRLYTTAFKSYINRGSLGINVPYHWHKYLEDNPNYENVVTQDIFIPLGPWLSGMDERQRYVADLMRYDIIHFTDAFKNLVILDGYAPEMLERWSLCAKTELRELKIRAYVKWRFTWAERRDASWEERLEQPNQTPMETATIW